MARVFWRAELPSVGTVCVTVVVTAVSVVSVVSVCVTVVVVVDGSVVTVCSQLRALIKPREHVQA